MVFAAPFLLALFAFYWLKSARWRDLLSPARVMRTRDLFPIIMIGYAGTAILPMQMGELVRAYIAGKRYELPYSLVLSSIGMERIFDLLTILALLGLVLATGQSTPPVMIQAGYVIGIITLTGLLLALLLVLRPAPVFATVRVLTGWLPAGVTRFIVEQLEAAAQGLASVARPRLLLKITGNSMLQWALMGVCIWLSLLALDLSLPVSGVVLTLVATIIGISLPTSPGYVGNIQLAFVVALGPFGVSPSVAIAASIFYHVLAYLAVVIVGFYCAHRIGFGMSTVRNEALESDPADAGS